MEIGYVSAASIVGMAVSFLLAVGFPINLLILVKRKTGAKVSSFFIGAGVFFTAALVLEQIFHLVVFAAVGDAIQGNIWLYALYGGTAAAVFEESGRLLAMKKFMKNRLDFPNALMYGVGHGGCEAIFLMGITGINNIVTSLLINSGGLQAALGALDQGTAQATLAQLSPLWTSPAYLFYMGGIERVFAILLHISFSLLMYRAVVRGSRGGILLPYLLHFLVDVAAVLINDYLGAAATELAMAVISVGLIAWTLRRERSL